MKLKIALFSLGASLILLALFIFVRQATYHAPKATPSPSPKVQLPYQKQNLTVTLKEMNNSKVSGKAQIEDIDGTKFKVLATVQNTSTSSATPIMIQSGSCTQLGLVKYALASIKKGSSETLISKKVADLLAQKPLSIVVHKSQKELTKITACGELP